MYLEEVRPVKVHYHRPGQRDVTPTRATILRVFGGMREPRAVTMACRIGPKLYYTRVELPADGRFAVVRMADAHRVIHIVPEISTSWRPTEHYPLMVDREDVAIADIPEGMPKLYFFR